MKTTLRILSIVLLSSLSVSAFGIDTITEITNNLSCAKDNVLAAATLAKDGIMAKTSEFLTNAKEALTPEINLAKQVKSVASLRLNAAQEFIKNVAHNCNDKLSNVTQWINKHPEETFIIGMTTVLIGLAIAIVHEEQKEAQERAKRYAKK